MNQAQLIHAAKQQDPAAIIALLNRSLLTRKIEVIAATSQEKCPDSKSSIQKNTQSTQVITFFVGRNQKLGHRWIRTSDRLRYDRGIRYPRLARIDNPESR